MPAGWLGGGLTARRSFHLDQFPLAGGRSHRVCHSASALYSVMSGQFPPDAVYPSSLPPHSRTQSTLETCQESCTAAHGDTQGSTLTRYVNCHFGAGPVGLRHFRLVTLHHLVLQCRPLPPLDCPLPHVKTNLGHSFISVSLLCPRPIWPLLLSLTIPYLHRNTLNN